jgi:hypothetical protein
MSSPRWEGGGWYCCECGKYCWNCQHTKGDSRCHIVRDQDGHVICTEFHGIPAPCAVRFFDDEGKQHEDDGRYVFT